MTATIAKSPLGGKARAFFPTLPEQPSADDAKTGIGIDDVRGFIVDAALAAMHRQAVAPPDEPDQGMPVEGSLAPMALP
ncbi:MAG: hypothetical protein IPG66_06815 [Hydrogenophilales bacterium]|nr:hypothetical protein [Hydrogenophilales bacterium]